MQHDLEKLLGISLPTESIGPVFFEKISPSDQLTYHYVFGRVDGVDQAGYEALVQDAPAFGERAAGQAAGFLPAAWLPAEGMAIPWWTPSPATPSNAVAAAYGQQGWIVAKWEAGSLFVLATDF